MRKFTTIATVMLLGGLGFTANADETDITPTVDPASGTKVFTLENSITVSWDDSEIALNTEADNYEAGQDFGDYETPAYLTISLLKDDEEWEDEWGSPVLTNAKLGEDSKSLIIEGVFNSLTESCTISFVLPAESVLIGDNEDTNKELTISYEYIFIPNGVTPYPSKGSTLFNVNTITLQWGEEENEEYGTPSTLTDIDSVNEECEETITYRVLNTSTYEEITSGELTEVSVSDGKATISFGESFAVAGQLTITIPEGYFLLDVDGETYPSPEVDFTYFLEPVKIYPTPSSWAKITGPFESFILYAEKSISLEGNLNDIVVADSEGNTYTVASYEETDVDDYEGIEFILENPCYSDGVTITIGKGTLNVDGSIYNSDLSWEYYLLSPTVTPAYGETLNQLDKVSLVWGDETPIELTEESNLTPTLSYNGGAAQDISENVSITTEEQEYFDYFTEEYKTREVQALVIDFSKAPFTEPGDYTITIPADYVFIDWSTYNNEMILKYTVVEASVELPDAEITSGLFGDKYMVTAWGASSINAEYLVDGEPVVLQFVDAEAEYATAKLTVPGSEETLDVMVGLSGNEYGIMAEEDDDEEEPVSGTSLVFLLGDVDYTWVAGDYSLTLPANVVKAADGAINGTQIIDFTVLTQFASKPSFNPEPVGDESNGYYSQTELSAVYLTYSGNLVLVEGDITYNEDEVLPASKVKVEKNELVLDLSSLTPGTYNFQIPSGYALVGEDAMIGYISFTYIVWNGLKPAEMIMGPAPVGQYATNIELSYGEDVSFAMTTVPALNVYEDFVEGDPVMTIPAANVSIQEVVVGEGGEPATGGDSTGVTEELSVLYLDIEELFAGKTGTYVIVIPEGLVKNASGAINPEQEISFTLQAAYDVEPEVEVSETGVVTVTWDGVDNVGNNGQVQAYLQTPTGAKEVLNWVDPFFGGEIEPNDDNDGVVIDLTEYLNADGDYLLVLPEGYFNLEVGDDMFISNELVVELTVENGNVTETEDGTTAVDSILNDAKVEGVYNLQGVKVSNDLNTLAPGLYIVNGKKVLVK